jgi:hypothetical protein
MEKKAKNYYQKIRKNIKKCYESIGEIVNASMHSILGNIIVLICTMFALFNVDVKILVFWPTADPTFVILNETIFLVLGLEFILLIMFKKKYIGSFFFYLDFLAVLSMIPDSEFMMGLLMPNSHDSHSSLGTTHHLIKASAASQAGAR